MNNLLGGENREIPLWFIVLFYLVAIFCLVCFGVGIFIILKGFLCLF